jgi:transposase
MEGEQAPQKKTRRHFDDQFKLDAVRLVTDAGRPMAQVAKELGIRADLLRKWRDQFTKKRTSAPSLTNVGKSPEQLEIEALKKQLARVEQEREILKKAMAVFSRERP